MGSHVTVHQLTSDWGKSFLNVDTSNGYIGVWGNTYCSPVILGIKGIQFALLEFDGEPYYKEWFEECGKEFDTLYLITEAGIEKIK